ncbi:extracellular solute-binding protein [Kitasatospora sp. NBC_01250]|uniref:extracellular solute-binding protein n=1 Tax=unclassified Kitasatospora TaxID=2633591 RepID=UPI002E14B733|nr:MULTISPECIES: extracellular solute-binding protein [unclassified Kitasatospora]WSJ68668.1 extracellular solute-binding protein [Kitasatospora sp. NBC_01302]
MKSRLFAVLSAGTLLTCGLTGCSFLGLGGGGTVTLKLVAADYGTTPDTSSQKYWNHLAKQFEAANPKIKVDVQVFSWSDIDAKVADMVKAGNSPDLVQTGGFADKVAAGQLYPASDVLSIDTQTNFLDSFNRAGNVLGTQYGIPFAASSRTFFYNKAIFRQAGITQPPATWDDLKNDAALIKAKVPGVTPYALPLGPEEAQAETSMWTMSGGSGITDAAGVYSLDSAQNVDTFNWLKQNLVDAHLTYPDPGKVNRQNAFTDFANGKVAMLNGHPTLLQQAHQGNIDFGTAPIPVKNTQIKPVSLGVADWMMAYSANGHRNEIRTFLSFAFNKDNTTKFDQEYNLLPVTQDGLAAMTANGQNAELKPFLDALPNASFYPFGDPAWDTVSGRIKTEIGTAVQGDPKPVLSDLQNYAVDQAKSKRPQ